MHIILFGEMGSGKSSVASYLVDKYDYFKCSLGEKIHSECELYNKHDREHLQKYGQMMREVFGKNIWCDYLYNRYHYHNKIIIDDGRQENEYDYFTNKGFTPVGIVANDEVRLERLKKGVNYEINLETFKLQSEHDTERQARINIEKCEIKITNNESLDELYEQIEFKLIGGSDG